MFGLNLRFPSSCFAFRLFCFGPLRATIDGAWWYALLLLIILALIDCMLFATLGVCSWLISTSFPPFSINLFYCVSFSCLAWAVLLWHCLGWIWAYLDSVCVCLFFFSILLVCVPWSYHQWWLNDWGCTFGVDSKLSLSMKRGCHGF